MPNLFPPKNSQNDDETSLFYPKTIIHYFIDEEVNGSVSNMHRTPSNTQPYRLTVFTFCKIWFHAAMSKQIKVEPKISKTGNRKPENKSGTLLYYYGSQVLL